LKVPDKFLVMIKQGSCAIRIYRGANKGYQGFKVAYYGNDGRRKVQTFADYEAAYKEAKKKVESLATGNLAALTLTNEDQLVYVRARSAADSVGVPLDIAAREFAEAKKLLGTDSRLEAVRIYLKSHRVLQSKTVQEAVDEFLHEKEALCKRPVSEVYVKDLRLRLGRFADAFHCEIRSVGPEEMRNFLNALKVKGRTCF
jgi:hypothetical protein